MGPGCRSGKSGIVADGISIGGHLAKDAAFDPHRQKKAAAPVDPRRKPADVAAIGNRVGVGSVQWADRGSVLVMGLQPQATFAPQGTKGKTAMEGKIGNERGDRAVNLVIAQGLETDDTGRDMFVASRAFDLDPAVQPVGIPKPVVEHIRGIRDGLAVEGQEEAFGQGKLAFQPQIAAE